MSEAEIAVLSPLTRLRMRAAEYLGAPALTAERVRRIDTDFLTLLGEPDRTLTMDQRDLFFLAATHAANSTLKMGERPVSFSSSLWPVRSMSALPYLTDSFLLREPAPTPATEITGHIAGLAVYQTEDPALQQLTADLQAIYRQDLQLV